MIIKLHDIIRSLEKKCYRISDHADEEMHNDDLTLEEVITSTVTGEIIESYSGDKPYPSCLVLGFNFLEEPIHTVWAHHKKNQASVLVTAYRPDSKYWLEDWKIRRRV
ncbi:MAG: DUF4258 domain-containing protein [Elusimicrobia bacterium]|nr:DUF4258 domain-containing protein [Elusimicrobiota bacterium]